MTTGNVDTNVGYHNDVRNTCYDEGPVGPESVDRDGSGVSQKRRFDETVQIRGHPRIAPGGSRVGKMSANTTGTCMLTMPQKASRRITAGLRVTGSVSSPRVHSSYYHGHGMSVINERV